ncbi:MAG: hypothetical protein AAFX55_16135 [Bacteroidota bacterium]
MYYLPIYIENRRIHINKLTEKPSDKAIGEFVISNASRNTLFTLKKGTKLLSEKGTKYDEQLIKQDANDLIFKLNITFKRDHSDLWILLETPRNESETPGISEEGKALEDLGLRYHLNNDGLALENVSNTSRILNCYISYQSYTSHLVFNIAASQQIVDAVFDFGSEASQIGVKFYNDHKTDFLNLVGLTYNYFYKNRLNDHTAKNEHFYQFEKGNNSVLLSYFFLKAQDGISNKIGTPFEGSKNSLIKILAKHTTDDNGSFIDNINKNNEEGHFLLPNLKLADSIDFPDIRFNIKKGVSNFFDSQAVKDYIFEVILCQFMHVLLKYIDEHYFTKNPNSKTDIYLKLNLLVPNIYSQHKVFDMLDRLTKDMKAIFKQPIFKNNFIGLELLTSSESDASFDFEGYEKERSKTSRGNSSDHCLVIDAGKGTTDFSIIECMHNPKQYISNHRSGIAGAGNLMTYAIMEAIVAIITDNDRRKTKDLIRNKILKADKYWQIRFFEEIEAIKKQYSTLDEIPAKKLFSSEHQYLDTSFEDLKEGNLKSLVSFLKNMREANNRVGDYYGIIDKSIDAYVNKLMKELEQAQEKKFYNIRFAGRAFLFNPLREKLEKKLKKFSSNIAHLKSPKTKCLDNSLDKRIKISENSNLVGIPMTSKGSVINQSNFFKNLGFEDSDEPKNAKTASDNFFLSGINLEKADVDTISISGYRYIPANQGLTHTSERLFNLIYTGDAFLLRSLENSSKLEIIVNNTDEKSDAIRSLFPNIPLGEEVPVIEGNANKAISDVLKYEKNVEKYIKLLKTP